MSIEKEHADRLAEELKRLEAEDEDGDLKENVPLVELPEGDLNPAAALLNSTLEKEEDEETAKPAPTKEKSEENILQKKAEERAGRRHQKISELESKLDTVLKRLDEVTSVKQQEAEEAKLAKLAEEYQTTPEVLKGLVSKLTPQKEEVAQFKSEPIVKDNTYDPVADPQQFNSEWNDFVPELAQEFPKATVSQLLEAKKFVEEEAYKTENINKSLSEIFSNRKVFKNLESVLKPGKKSFETSDTHEVPDTEEEEDDFESDITSTAQAIKAQQKMFKMVQGDKLPIHRSSAY